MPACDFITTKPFAREGVMEMQGRSACFSAFQNLPVAKPQRADDRAIFVNRGEHNPCTCAAMRLLSLNSWWL